MSSLPIYKLTEKDRKRLKKQAEDYEKQGHPLPKKPGYEESLCRYGGCSCVGIHKYPSGS